MAMAKRVALAALALAYSGCIFNEAADVDGDASQYEIEERRHEDSLAGMMSNMTIEVALSLLAKNPSASPQLLGLVQHNLAKVTGATESSFALATGASALRGGQEPTKALAGAGETATATDKLNEMIFEVQAKYELEHQKCCEYDRSKRLLIEDTAQDIALFNAEAAQGRSGILSAETQLQIGNSRVPKLQEALQENTKKCDDEAKALDQQLQVVLNDIPVLSQVLDMTDCSNPANQEKKPEEKKPEENLKLEEKVKLLLAKAGHKVSPHFRHLVEHNLQEHDKEMMALAQGVAYVRNSSHGHRHHALHQQGRQLHRLRAHKADQPLLGMKNPLAAPPTPVASSVPTGPCAKPTAQDISKGSCALGPASCGKLNERFLNIQVSLVDKRDQLKLEAKRVETSCKGTNEAINNQIAGYTANLMAAQTSLARWTKVQNDADEQNRLKTVEKTKMESEFKEMTQTCQSNYLGFEAQECGLRKIRGELAKLKNQSLTPYFQDCQVSAWSPEACSAPCGGGTQTLRRSIVTPPAQGVKCLPLAQVRTCNTHSCPQDCKQADWAAWSGCTAECGGGVQQREREVLQKARYGGKPCGDVSETRSCNIQSCNQDCVLNEWTEWSGCSKACGDGRQRRFRTVKQPAAGTGKCADAKEESRLQFRSCNSNQCPSDLRCKTVLDVVLVLDGSGEAGANWQQTKSAAAKLITGLGGTGGANLAVLAYGGPQNWKGIAACTGEGPQGQSVDTEKDCKLQWVSHLTADAAGLRSKLDALPAPEGSRLTSAALGLADVEFTVGRQDVPDVVIVITGGAPLNTGKTQFISDQLRKKARLMWVTVSSADSVDLYRKLASQPDDENVLVLGNYQELNEQRIIDHIVASLCPTIGQVSAPLSPPTFTKPMTYADLNKKLDAEWQGKGVCGEGRHVCNYEEVTILSVGNGFDSPKGGAWIVGNFPNMEGHRRSIWNSQDSTQCKDGRYPKWWDRWGPYLGRVHCESGSEQWPVACCGDVKPQEDPTAMRLSSWKGSYNTLSKILDDDNNGGPVCGGGFHVCNYQEVTVYAAVKGSSPPGWIVGGFSNWEGHRRSIWNGQDSTQCQANKFPRVYQAFGPYYGGIHCEVQGAEYPVTCCANLQPQQRNELVRLNGKAITYNTLNSQLDADWQGRSTCGNEWHVCNFQEVTVYMSALGVDVGEEAWIVGGFSNMESHRRSIWNGQDSNQCKENMYPFVYKRWNNYYGRVHCAAGKDTRQVLCCKDDGWKGLN